jgi:ubiquinone/menaquinone biosynthesis C-methylase UbiE
LVSADRNTMRAPGLVITVLVLLSAGAAAQGPRFSRGQLFPPEDLGVLESPDRNEWQQPDRIMDELRIGEGSKVADIGAGGGWFTVRLARRVWPTGIVYAEDIQPAMIGAIERRVRELDLTNVQTRLGTADNPNLPTGLNAVLMVDTYTQLGDPVRLLRQVAVALAPNGLLGVVDFNPDGAGGPGPKLETRVSPEVVARDAREAGLTLRARHTFLRYQYFLVFGKTAGASPGASPRGATPAEGSSRRR